MAHESTSNRTHRPKHGSLALTSTTPVPLSATRQGVNEVEILNLPSNTDTIYVGLAAAQLWPLLPGDSKVLPFYDLALVYLKLASGVGPATVVYFANGS